jgi:hypothetical protein
LNSKIFQFNTQKEKAGKYEDLLKHIRTKVESYRLSDMNKDLMSLIENFEGIYDQSEGISTFRHLEDSLQLALKTNPACKSVSFVRAIVRPTFDLKNATSFHGLPSDISRDDGNHKGVKFEKESHAGTSSVKKNREEKMAHGGQGPKMKGNRYSMKNFPIISAQSTALTDKFT